MSLDLLSHVHLPSLHLGNLLEVSLEQVRLVIHDFSVLNGLVVQLLVKTFVCVCVGERESEKVNM